MTGKIYLITNKINGKQYIGQTIRDDRFLSHMYNATSMKNTSKKMTKFYNAVVKYGIENFEESIIEESVKLYSFIDTKQTTLDMLEIKYIEEYDTYVNGYNSTVGGDGVLGYRHTDDSKMKMSMSHKKRNIKLTPDEIKHWRGDGFKGRTHSDETKMIISRKNKGNKHTDETKEIISKTHKGVPKSESHKKLLSESKIGKNNPNFGKKHSNNTKDKISNKMKKQKFCDIMLDDKVIHENMIWNDVIKLHQGLRNTSKDKPLGRTPQSKALLSKSDKLHMVGWYIIHK